MTKKRRRSVHLHVMVTPEEQALIADRMAEAGISNMGSYMRKMALNGYVLHVDLSDIRELVALQRRCANNLNQVAIHANTYGIYPSEIAALQKDYADLWTPLSELLKKLSAIVAIIKTTSKLVVCTDPRRVITGRSPKGVLKNLTPHYHYRPPLKRPVFMPSYSCYP